MAERALVGYARVTKLEMKKRMQYALTLEINGLSEIEVRHVLEKEYGYNAIQARRIIVKAHANVKELLKNNMDRLTTTVLAKMLQVLRQAEENDNLRLQLETLRDIRTMCNLDKGQTDNSQLPKNTKKTIAFNGL